jgi:ABC-2 type transport system ATP-binding protein
MPRALALQARGLTKAYRGVVAVESLDLEVETGTILGFLGPNGAGKTTVIRMLSTILRPDAGWFAVAGVPQDQPVEIRRRVGVLPESAGYPPGQTGHEWLSSMPSCSAAPARCPCDRTPIACRGRSGRAGRVADLRL